MSLPDKSHTNSPAGDADHGHHADVGSAPPVTPATTRRMVTAGIVIVAVFAVLLLSSFLPRRAVSKELAAEVAGEDAPAVVQVAAVKRAAEGGTVELPGTIQPLHESAVYARVTGYVKSWHADIGNAVHAGDVLAEIDAPELVQEVSQAEHQLAQARATLGLAKADLARWKTLVADSAVTREEFDQKQAAYDAADANTGAAAANLQRLHEMQNFMRVRAPFTGVVTARNIDIGSLITAAGATSAPVAGGDVAGQQGPGSMFRIAETDTVRTYIPVPENYATSMGVGLPAHVTVQELPGRVFTGHIVRTSHAIDAGSRTLLTEVDIANPGFLLLPGMYSNVQVQFGHSDAPLIVPAAALVIRSAGTQVIVVDTAASVIHLKNVVVGRDYGSRIEILSGISDGTVIVTNPNADLTEGMKVKITATPATMDKK
jgi:membrane fusion protein, multidrug efflux system